MLLKSIRKSLRLKIVLVSVIVELVILALLITNSMHIVSKSIEHQANIKKESTNPLLDSALSIPLFERDYATLIELLDKLIESKNSEFTYINVYDDVGNIFSEKTRKNTATEQTTNEKILHITAPLTIANDKIGTVKYGLSIQSLYDTKTTLLEEGLLIAIAGIILTIVLLGLTSYYLTRHVTELLRCAKDVTSGHYDVNIPINSPDEIGLLAKEFNNMASAIKKTIAEINSRNSLLRKISSRVPGMVYQFKLQTDGSMSFPYVSDAVESIYHITANDVYNDVSTIFSKTHPDDVEILHESIQKSAQTLEPWELEYRVLDDDGSIRWVFGNSLAEKMPNGDIVWHGFVTDITANKEMTDTLRRSQKMDALGNLTGGIAHDYNNMLGVVIGFADLLKEQTADLPELNEYANEISNASERGAKLTKKLLDFSRQKSTYISVVNINEMLRNDQDMLQKTLTARINLELKLDDNIWQVYIDGSELEDAVLNLCINAMHSIQHAGQITIQTNNIMIGKISARNLGLSPGDYVHLSITDTGCGINDSLKEKIFDPFYTTKGQGGTGLGLSQVYGFMSRSRGTIKVDSKVGEGSTFSLYFPKANETSTDPKPAEIKHDAPREGTETILVVDDEPALLKLTHAILSKHGYEVLQASSARQALEIISNQHIELLISDIIMPEMDGYTLASIVQEKYPHIKIQLVSGYSDENNLGHEDSALSENILLKPYNIQSLLDKIHRLLPP